MNETDPLSNALRAVLAQPPLFIPYPKFDTIVAFLCGYDMATGGRALIGLQEWLVVKIGTGNSVAWPALLRHYLAPNPADPDVDLERVNSRLLEMRVYALFDEFFSERDQDGGLQRILDAHRRWLKSQPWYTSPHGKGPA